jgi:hypothetical protein
MMKRNITHEFENFDDAPHWADRILLDKTQNTFVWSDGAMYAPILRNPPQTIHDENQFEIVAERPAVAFSINNKSEADVITTVYKPMSLADLHLAHLFTPAQQPSTAPDLLKQAAQLLAERGQQYDKSGNERSAAKIVAAFNAVTGRDLTPGEGWLFLVMLKAVRFYSNTETPHRDSLEDMIAYAALHAEEYLNDK